MPRAAAILAVSMFVLAACDGPTAPPAANTTEAATPIVGTTAPAEGGDAIAIGDATVQLPVVPGRPGAAYFNVTGNRTVIIEKITSPAAPRIEFHQTLKDGNVARMEKFDVLAIAGGETKKFEPGGMHAMLFDLQPELRSGQTVPLTFTIQGEPPVTVEAQVRTAGE